MREDMSHVIVERPRIKPFNARRGRRVALDDTPNHEGMRRSHAWHGDRKQLNENLAPLRRYLERQVGRPWDKVYSEIAAGLRVDNAVQQHVRDHVRDFVALVPRQFMHSSSGGAGWWQRLYVNPATGLLCRTDKVPAEKARQRARRHTPPKAVEHIMISKSKELRLIKGIWYEVELAPLPDPIYRVSREVLKLPLSPYHRNSRMFEAEMDVRRLASPAVWDVATSRMIEVGPAIDNPAHWKAYRLAQPERSYAISKHVLSRRELRLHGLGNADACC